MKTEFTKMNGLGNDYVFIDAVRFPIADPSGLARLVSDRRGPVGSDGLVLIGASSVADFSMRIFNADGSRAQMCGNAARCVGRYVLDKGLWHSNELFLETDAGVRKLVCVDGSSVRVHMGEVLVEPLSAGGFDGFRVDVGNPHFVVFTSEDILVHGPALECDPAFPERTNVEFARIAGPCEISMRVWERGSGHTKACGTGACAVAAASGLGPEVSVQMEGGALRILIRHDRTVEMTGPVEFEYESELEI